MLNDNDDNDKAEPVDQTADDPAEPIADSYNDGDYIVHARHGHISFEALLGSSYEPVCYTDVVSGDDDPFEIAMCEAKLEICGALESLLSLDYDEFKTASAVWLSKLSVKGDNISLTAKKLHRTRQQIYRRLDKIFSKAPVLRFLIGDYEAARKADG